MCLPGTCAALFLFPLCALLHPILCFAAFPLHCLQRGTLSVPPALSRPPSPSPWTVVCCVDIQAVDNEASPHGNANPLGDVIRQASTNASYSWCTCSEEICIEQLRGRVAWNQNGAGWRGFRADPRRVRAYYTGTGGGEGHSGL